MTASRQAHYPSHLAKLVARGVKRRGHESPPDHALLKLLETLYFASLSTDEGRPCRCIVNFVASPLEVEQASNLAANHDPAPRWQVVRFEPPLPLDVPTLTKLAEAADPHVSSLVTGPDSQGKLVIWGMVDHELRYGDFIAQGAAVRPSRVGLFQATIAGVGNISVSKDYELLGCLEHHMLVREYHDVLWAGPVYKLLRKHLRAVLARHGTARHPALAPGVVEEEMLTRWQNAVCRTLLHIQQYRHGGGLLIDPDWEQGELHIKYRLTYDRLPRALLRLVHRQLIHNHTSETISEYCHQADAQLPCQLLSTALANQAAQSDSRSEALSCARYIAALSKVDGFVLLDEQFVVHGFGVEVRPSLELTEIFIAGDPLATPKLMRPASLSQFGTRHRAMMRYCNQNAGALGFIVSQDGDIRATMKVGGRLILWENINLQLAFKAENRAAAAA